jgi:hypothetical protein
MSDASIHHYWTVTIRTVKRLDAGLAARSRFAFLTLGTIVSLALVACFLAARWNVLLTDPEPVFEWYRGLNFVQQCEDPWAPGVDPSLRARLLPPLFAKALGLKGYAVFAIAWVGAVVLVFQTLRWAEVALKSRLAALAFAVCVSTTSAVVVPMHWLGINDAWVWLGLLAVVFARASWTVPLACLLCPWIDERFLFALPLAVWCRTRLDGTGFWKRAIRTGTWLVPFLVLRIILHATTDEGASAHYLAVAYAEMSLARNWAPLGWWMGLRAVWVLAVIALIDAAHKRCAVRELAFVMAAVGVTTFLAHDYSRSVALLLPWIALGAVRWRCRHGRTRVHRGRQPGDSRHACRGAYGRSDSSSAPGIVEALLTSKGASGLSPTSTWSMGPARPIRVGKRQKPAAQN